MLRNRRIVLIIVAFVNVFSFLGILRLRIVTDPKIFLGEGSRYEKSMEEVERIFGIEDQIGVLLHIRNARTPDSLNIALELQRKLRKIPGVESVSGVPEFIIQGLRPVRIDRFDSETTKKVLSFLSLLPMKIIGKDWVFINVAISDGADPEQVLKEVRKLVKNLNCDLTGNTFIQEQMFKYIILVLFSIPPFIVILLILIFGWKLGSVKGGALSIMPAGIAALWTMGFLGYTSPNMSVLSVLVPIFVIILGSADGLHFISHYLESKRGVDGAAETLKIVGMAMIMTTLTTMVSFFSFLFLPSESLKSLGLYSGIGIGFAAISTWIMLPTILPASKLKSKGNVLGRLIVKSSKKTAIIGFLIALAFIPGIFRVEKSFSLIGFYRPYTSVRKSFENVMRKTGYALPVYIYGKSSNPLAPDNAKRILRFEREIKNGKMVIWSFSIYDLIKALSEYLFRLNEYPKSAPLLYLAMERAQPNRVSALLRNGNFLILSSIKPTSDKEALERIAENNGMKITGMPYILSDLNDKVVSSQIKSILFVMSLVFLMLFFMTKSLKVSLVSIVPISLTLLILFGFMGYRGIPLNVTTTIMAAITIGVGIDYAIHYAVLHEKFGKDEAIRRVSTPIFANALGFSLGYTPMILSPFTIHVYLVQIMWVVMMASAFLTLLIVPTMLDTLKKAFHPFTS